MIQLFHNLAAPILYQSIIAPDLVTLLQGLGPEDTARSSRRIKRKVDLVDKTIDLRIIGLGPPIHTIPHLSLLLQGDDDWTQIGLARGENHKRVRRLAIQEMARFHEITSDYNCPLERPHFQNLKRLILGQRFDRGREYLKEKDEELVGFARGVMDTFICAHQPKYICVNTSCGPYAPRMIIYDEEIRTWTTTRTVSQAAKDARGFPVVTKHLYTDGISVPQVAFGAVNRWIIPPGTVMHRTDGWDGFEVGSNFAEDIRITLGCWERAIEGFTKKEWQELKSKTTLDMYGQAIGQAATSHLLRHSTTEVNRAPRPDGHFPPKEVKRMEE